MPKTRVNPDLMRSMSQTSPSPHPPQNTAQSGPETDLPNSPSDAIRLPWVPIRSLAPSHKPKILNHLMALSDSDRYLRFGYQISPENLGSYVQGLDFERDEIFGVFNRRLNIVALAHLAYPSPSPVGSASCAQAAEFGGSVLAHSRGRGYGARLFDHAMLHARNRGLRSIYIHALSENAAMLRIAHNAGAAVQRDGSESEAYLSLPPETLASHVEQAVSDGAAALDYQIKWHAHRTEALFEPTDGGV